MFRVYMYIEIRRDCLVEGMSIRAAARKYGLHRSTVKKMLENAEPPGYLRAIALNRPAIDGYTDYIDTILAEDNKAPKKQRHTVKRIFDRLSAENQYKGSYSSVYRYVSIAKNGLKKNYETYIPLVHPPGTAQADFGQAIAMIASVEVTIHFFVMDLPFSDACFVKAYMAENSESFCDGHVSAFSFFGGVPIDILYDNTTIAVSRILKSGKREQTSVFSSLQSHYLFNAKFAQVGKGNEKGKVENLVGYARRNFMVPVPNFASLEDLNKHLEECCTRRQQAVLRGQSSTIAERMLADQKVFIALPSNGFESSVIRPARVSKTSLVRYDNNDYSVPVNYAYRNVLIKAYVGKIVICYESEKIATHERCYGTEQVIYDPVHYLTYIEYKIKSFDQAAPLVQLQSQLPNCFRVLRNRLESRDGKHGLKCYITILKLLADFKIDAVAKAIEYSLSKNITDIDSIKTLILAQVDQDKKPVFLDLKLSLTQKSFSRLIETLQLKI